MTIANRIQRIAAAIILAAAVSSAQAAETLPVLPSVNNARTASHVQVPATGVMLIPPRGAEPASSFRGFEDSSRGIRVEVTELGAPYSESISMMDPKELSSRGAMDAVVSRRSFNGRPALCASAKTSGEGQVFLLLIGDETSSSLIAAQWPAGDSAAGRDATACALSAVRSDRRHAGGGDADLGFAISTRGTPYQPDGVMNFTRRFKSSDGAAVFEASVSMRAVSQDARMELAKSEFDSFASRFGGETSAPQLVSVSGMHGIEITSSFDGETRRRHTASGGRVARSLPGAAYQLILFHPSGRVFTMQGAATRDAPIHIENFKKISRSITVSNAAR